MLVNINFTNINYSSSYCPASVLTLSQSINPLSLGPVLASVYSGLGDDLVSA